MKNNFLLRLPLLLLMLTIVVSPVKAQDTVKKTVAKKAATVKPGGIPINPKTGRPYSKYGYGAYAKTYKTTQKADSVKKAPPIKASTTTIAITPPPVPPADTATAAAPTPTADKSLNGQYHYLLTKVYRYQQPFIDALWKNFTDTLKSNRSQLNDAHEKLNQLNKTITSLQADIASKDQALSETDSISLFGLSLSKTAYSLLMWGLVIVIGIIAGVVITQSGGYRSEAVHRTALYTELEEEFKTYKSKANEKEKKLARELQTERNKVDELMGRG